VSRPGGADRLEDGRQHRGGGDVEPFKPTRWKVRSSAIWSKCGSVQVENNRARSAGSSYRFRNLFWEGYREAFQASFPDTFFPRAVPWAVIVLHLRRAKPTSRAGSLSFPAPLRQGFRRPGPGLTPRGSEGRGPNQSSRRSSQSVPVFGDTRHQT